MEGVVGDEKTTEVLCAETLITCNPTYFEIFPIACRLGALTADRAGARHAVVLALGAASAV